MARKRIAFSLDDSDVAYFRDIYRAAKDNTTSEDWPKIARGVRRLVKQVREAKRVPKFVTEAIDALEDLMRMVEDEDYATPQNVVDRTIAALAYFANPKDVIPDDVPLVGFLDDAIMIRFVEEDLKHELWGYRKFRNFRAGSEQRHWTPVAKERMRERLTAKRKEIRGQIQDREAKERQSHGRRLGW